MGDSPSKEEDNKTTEFTNKLKNAMTAFLEEMESWWRNWRGKSSQYSGYKSYS